MSDFLPTLTAGITYTSVLTGLILGLRWALIAVVALIGVLSQDDKGRNARTVLKTLLRRRRRK